MTDAPRHGRQHPPSDATPARHDVARTSPALFFLPVTAALGAAAVVLTRTQPAPTVLLLAVTVCAAGVAAFALFRALSPLVTPDAGEQTAMAAGRTRAALERDKALTLRAIKELEFDHAMGKVADADFAEMRSRLRARAVRLLRQLDGSAAYRSQIERDLARVIGEPSHAHHEQAGPAAVTGSSPAAEMPAAVAAARQCAVCLTGNEPDARFCKMCGRPLAEHV